MEQLFDYRCPLCDGLLMRAELASVWEIKCRKCKSLVFYDGVALRILSEGKYKTPEERYETKLKREDGKC